MKALLLIVPEKLIAHIFYHPSICAQPQKSIHRCQIYTRSTSSWEGRDAHDVIIMSCARSERLISIIYVREIRRWVLLVPTMLWRHSPFLNLSLKSCTMQYLVEEKYDDIYYFINFHFTLQIQNTNTSYIYTFWLHCLLYTTSDFTSYNDGLINFVPWHCVEKCIRVWMGMESLWTKILGLRWLFLWVVRCGFGNWSFWILYMMIDDTWWEIGKDDYSKNTHDIAPSIFITD